MTIRAFLIGIITAVLIATFGYVNDWLLDLERFNSGHLLPIIVVGPLLLFSCTINTLLQRFFPKFAFRGAELAIIFFLASTACSITGRNLMEHLPHVMIMPHHWYQVTPGWNSKRLLDYFPKNALVDPDFQNDVVSGFVNGSGKPEDLSLPFLERTKLRFSRVPWRPWLAPLRLWLPIAILSSLCFACISLILHQQWASHEHLAYPIADFVAAFLKPGPRQATPALFQNRFFWYGLAIVFLLRLNNGLCRWFPEYLIPVQLLHRFTPFAKLFPSLARVPLGPALFQLDIFPLVIAFAFLLRTEISLTLGLSQFLWIVAAAPFVAFGVDFNTNYSGMGWSGWQRACSYIAFACMIAYTGRHYYSSLLRNACFHWTRGAGQGPVWAARILFLAMALWIWAVVAGTGLPLFFAILTLFLGLLSGIVVSRISTETGLFFIHTRWQPFALMLACFGSHFMNPSVLVSTIMVCFFLSIDQSQCYLPYLANAMKVCDELKVPRHRLTAASWATCTFSIFTALIIALLLTYDRGTPKQCAWSWNELAKICFVAADPEVLQLKSVNLLEHAEQTPWHQKLSAIRPKKNFLWAALVGFGGVMLFSFLRLRHPWWPLHPVLFLVWMTWPMYVLSSSFFLGWLLKKIVIRIGGFAFVQKLKPFMFGVIGGEILGAVLFLAIGAVYFLITDKPPVAYRYFPR